MLPLDIYFKKQEACQKLAADGEVPISEADMVLQLQDQVGSTCMINTKYATWKKKSLTNRSWKDRKKYFRTALNDMSEINKLTTSESGLTANLAIKKENMEDKICLEIVEKFGDLFDTLALAETVNSDTIDALEESFSDLTKTNIALTKANVNLVSTNKKLTTQLESTKGRSNQPNNQPSNNTKKTKNNEEWRPWCDPDAYCSTCGYKLRKGHDSSNIPNAKNNLDHKKGATLNNTMVDIRINVGFGNAPNKK